MRSLDILVVDDERDLALGVADLLETSGHRVTLAHCAELALELAEERVFDVVFLDVKLPGMTGIDILLQLRRALPNVRIVPMTGYRIDNLLGAVAGDDNFVVLGAPATEDRVSSELRTLGLGGMAVVPDPTEHLGRRLAKVIGDRGEAVCLAKVEAEAFGAEPFSGSDVLILDLGRTVARGLETYLAIREGGSNPKTVIIARVPGDSEATANPWRSISVSGCLFKPFDPAELMEIVSDLANDPERPRQRVEVAR